MTHPQGDGCMRVANPRASLLVLVICPYVVGEYACPVASGYMRGHVWGFASSVGVCGVRQEPTPVGEGGSG
jgi:hypothetical protein